MCTVVTHVFEMSKMCYMRIVILENQRLISKLQVEISSQTGDTQIYSIVKSYQIIKWINLKKILPISPIYLLQGIVNPIRAKFTKWTNTLKQFVGNLPTNCLSAFDHFVELALKGLTYFMPQYLSITPWKVPLCFQGVEKETSGMEWVNMCTWLSEVK